MLSIDGILPKVQLLGLPKSAKQEKPLIMNDIKVPYERLNNLAVVEKPTTLPPISISGNVVPLRDYSQVRLPVTPQVDYKPITEKFASQGMNKVIGNWQSTIKSIENLKNNLQGKEPSLVDVLTQIKDLMQTMVDHLTKLDEEMNNQITLDQIVDVVKKITPSSVKVTGVMTDKIVGSGVVINGKNNTKYILTNAHVVQAIDDNSGFLTGTYNITMYDGTDKGSALEFVCTPVFLKSMKRAYSGSQEHDIAILEIPKGTELPASVGVDIRDLEKDPIKAGECVLAVGSPFGRDDSISFGIVSHVDRENNLNVNSMIQTDAATGPGSSGGGLFDMKGRLVGINTLGFGGSFGASIRIDEIKKLLVSWGLI